MSLLKSKIIPCLSLIFILTGCKKDYTCRCGNPGGVTATYKISDTKRNAESKCSSYCKNCNALFENYCELK